jgi:hypothetical protein
MQFSSPGERPGGNISRQKEDAQIQVSDHVQVKLSGGRIVEARIKAIVRTTEGVRLQVSFRGEMALIYLWQIVEE